MFMYVYICIYICMYKYIGIPYWLFPIGYSLLPLALTIQNMDWLRRSPGLIAMYFSYAALWGIFAAATMGAVANRVSQ